jgi:NitT/TauT family transport system permease protein
VSRSDGSASESVVAETVVIDSLRVESAGATTYPATPGPAVVGGRGISKVAGRPMDELEQKLLVGEPARGPRRSKVLAISLGTCLVLLFLWWLLPNAGLVNPLLLPDPFDVAKGFGKLVEADVLLHHLGVTMTEIGYGFAIGGTAGFLLGTVLGTIPFVRRVLSPYILALQSLPKVVLAPLLIGALGFGIESKVATAVAICFFPLMINTMVGLTLAAADPMKLMHSLGASRVQIYTKLRLPVAAPLIMVGFKHSVLLAFTGALVAEMLVGSSEGLGRLIAIYNQQILMDLAFAVVVLLATIAVTAVMLLDWLDRRIIFWREDKVGVK